MPLQCFINLTSFFYAIFNPLKIFKWMLILLPVNISTDRLQTSLYLQVKCCSKSSWIVLGWYWSVIMDCDGPTRVFPYILHQPWSDAELSAAIHPHWSRARVPLCGVLHERAYHHNHTLERSQTQATQASRIQMPLVNIHKYQAINR